MSLSVSAPTPPRVRFAPSPTGYFHVGSARTSLYNWAFARHLGGVFVLRIEDTDRERSEEKYTEGICNALTWLGLNWDEGPYLQSERRELYDQAAKTLFTTGHLYACDCTRDDIDARAKESGRQTPGYDGFCRDRGLEPGEGRAMRFRVADEGSTIVHDIVRGDVEFPHNAIDDFVVVKSNGDPLFVLAVVVDDIDMGITHIIRAEEHLPTTPKAIMLWQALDGPQLPQFAHVPVLVNEKRQKLSKRRDRVAIEDYAALGYLPEAILNYLELLGWGPGEDREVLTIDEFINEFRLEDVIRSPAFFDEKRLTHFNGVYIRNLELDEFVRRSLPFVLSSAVPWPAERFNEEEFRRLAPLIKERVSVLGEVASYVSFLFDEPFEPNPADVEKAIKRDEVSMDIIKRASELFVECPWDHDAIREVVMGIGVEVEKGLAKTQAPIRVATLGRSIGLPLFESLEVLGKERTLERLNAFIN